MTGQGERPHRGGRAAGIEVRDLVKVYGGGQRAVPALDGVTFTVPAGAVVSLLGPNGAGKSTTVRILTTLTRPDQGTASVGGLDVTTDAPRVRRLIGYVPQRPSFDPSATGRENLMLQGRIHGTPGREARRRTADLLERFGLSDAADRIARTWSGGMQRKLDVALGLIHRPQILFLDEPTTGLDPEARADLWAELGGLAAAERLTVLLTTHYLEEADRAADEVVIIDRGRVVAWGTPDKLKAALGNDTIQVRVAQPQDAVRAHRALEQVAGAGRVAFEDQALRVTVASGETALPHVLAALGRADVELMSLTLARPSLDDVYLRHTGRSFRTADAAEQKEVA